MNIRNKNLYAFTLIELLVVMAIIGIMTSVVVASLSNSRVQRELSSNAQIFIAVLREAQNNALAGRRLVASSDPCQFSVSWTELESAYQSVYYYGTPTCTDRSSSVSYTLRNGVVFSGTALTSVSVSFALPYATTADKTIVLKKSGLYHTVCVYANGRMSDHTGYDAVDNAC